MHEVEPQTNTTFYGNSLKGQLATGLYETGSILTTFTNLRLNEMNSWQLVNTILVQQLISQLPADEHFINLFSY